MLEILPLARVLAASFLLFGLGSCESLLVDPASPSGAAISISFSAEAATLSRGSGEGAEVDHARIRITDELDGSLVLDTTVALPPESTETRVRLFLPEESSGRAIQVQLDLLDGDIVVGSGTGRAEPRAGSMTEVAIAVTVPVGAVEVKPASPTIAAGSSSPSARPFGIGPATLSPAAHSPGPARIRRSRESWTDS